MTHHIHLESIDNLRDFGGYDTACGRGLKAGRLYRSANHSYATPQDLAVLRDLGVQTIVDLRRPRERAREPAKRWDGFAAQVIENDQEGEHGDWADVLAAAERIDADWFFQDSLAFYAKGPFEPRHIDLFRRYFRALGEADGAVVVHCAAGKDRTGMICALTHHLAGVHRDDTLADFLATNHEGRMAGRVQFLGPWIKDLTGVTVDDRALRVAVSVNEAYLDRAFQSIHERCGSVDAYLEAVLGVDAELRGKIEQRILG